ncbi:MAG: hypothetical protein ACKO96_07840, partial [Flammeovirgaceae bacterium]
PQNPKTPSFDINNFIRKNCGYARQKLGQQIESYTTRTWESKSRHQQGIHRCQLGHYSAGYVVVWLRSTSVNVMAQALFLK